MLEQTNGHSKIQHNDEGRDVRNLVSVSDHEFIRRTVAPQQVSSEGVLSGEPSSTSLASHRTNVKMNVTKMFRQSARANGRRAPSAILCRPWASHRLRRSL